MASVFILVIVVVGAVGYRSLGVDKFPKVDFPAITVTTLYPGASPTSVERDVTEPLEAAINTVSGVDTLSSTTTEGVSVVIVMFDLDKDVDVASQEVRDRIAAVRSDLPTGVQEPKVQKMDPSETPVLMLSLKGDLPIAELTRIADDTVRSRIETIAGVGQVQVIGGRERRINIHLDPVRMRGAGVSALEVQRAIGVGNADVPGGQLDQGPVEGTLRIVGRVGSPERLGDLVVRQIGDRPIRVRDVADIEDGLAEVETAGFRDGVPSVVLAVKKQSGGNTVEVVDDVRAAAATLTSELPDGVTLEVVRDNSESIRTSIGSVLEHLVIGALLAALVVLVFLGDARSTLIAAISIPVSLIGTFALMSWMGFTLNMMTLLALALSVGIVIDDSIVVLENVHRYIHEKGMKPFPAAVHATREIAPAVLATSLSLMAVFLPVAFMGGIVGRMLASFGITMAFAVAVSMIVSFTLVPMLAARMLPPAPAPGTHAKKSLLVRAVDAVYAPIERAYMAMLRFSMRRRWVIVALSVGALASVPVLAKTAGFGFLPENDDAQFEVYVETPKGTSLDATAVYAERVARIVRGVDGTAYTLTTIGDGAQQAPNVARIYVRLDDPSKRKASQAQVMAAARQALEGRVPDGTQVGVQLIADIGGGSKNAVIQYTLSGPDLDKLELYGRKVAVELAKVPGAVDVSTNLTEPSGETRLYPDLDRAAALGVDPGDLASTLRVLVGGADTSKYEEDGEQYDVFVRAGERYRDDPSALALLTVPSRTLGQVPLSDVVTIDAGVGPSQINRLSRTRQVTINANLAPGASQGNVVAAIERIVADLDLPAGYHAQPFGQAKEMAKMKTAFLFAFLLAFLFMYLVLAAQFESWLHPLTILLALPLTLPFAFLAVVLFGQQLNLFSILGLLVLFGVVKKNSILQIDQTNQLRAAGMGRLAAILEANRTRLRPILMTTVAFVVGMLPLVFSHGIGAGFSRAMATLVVGGQSLSLLLTLLAIPVIYSLFDDVSLWVGRIAKRAGRGRSQVDRGEAELAGA
jgi:hydrophobe/amphiphile efflux-1 (HAE1) family protein